MLTKVELPQGYKRLINKEKERKDVIQIIDDEGFLREISFDELTSHPTTISGYGITDAYTKAEVDSLFVTPDMITSFVNDADYNSTTKEIELKHGSTVVATVDATAFIKDGMVSSVTVENGYIVIEFNTDAGQEAIRIPITDIFDSNNYYTKAESDARYITEHQSLAGYTPKVEAIPYIEGPTTDTTAGHWTGTYEGITALEDGLTIIYVPYIAGASTTTLNINGLGAKTCYYSGTSKLTTHYPVGTPILLTYHNNGWRRADYNSNTTYSAGTKALFDAGTNTSNRVWSAAVLADTVAPIVHTHLWADITDAPAFITADALNGYATEQWVQNQGYLTEHQDLSAYALSEDIPTALSQLSQDSTHRLVTDTEKTTWSAKQDAISDLSTIRDNASHGNTAYNWGNHAEAGYAMATDIPENVSELTNDAGYITSADVPTSLAELSDDSTHRLVTDAEKTTWNNKQDAISDLADIRSGAALGATALQSETDPIFSASPSAGITSTDIDNWNAKQAAISDLSTIRTRSNEGHTAYGWGNHAEAGYLTSFTETDPIFSASPAHGITTTNITNWNTAFNWGNHASEGYLKSVSFADLTSHPTTLSGYGITDAKIQNGVITLGGNTITPLTSFTETDPTVPSWAKQSTKPSYTASEVGALPDTTFIPTKTSDITNDSGFITSADIPANVSEFNNDAGYITSSDIPTNVSAFNNDAGYLTEHQSLANYYNKSEVDTKTAKTTALADNKLLYNGQTVDTALSGLGISTSTNLLNSGYHMAIRSNDNNPFFGLKQGTNLWYAQAAAGYFYFGPTSTKALRLDQNGNGVFQSGSVTATKIIKSGGTASQFLKADGSIDSNTYLTSHQSLAGYATESWVQSQGYLTEHQSLSGYATEDYVDDAITDLNLGTASQKDFTTSITQNNTSLPTSGAVYDAIASAVTSAIHYRGMSSVALTDGGTEVAVIGGTPLVAQSGDVVIYGGYEFLWEEEHWNKLGDDTSYALKTVAISAGTGLTGGGDLTSSRTIGLSTETQNSIANGVTAYGWGNHASQGYATQTWVSQNFNKYVLPKATTSTLGGVIIGDGLSVDADGKITPKVGDADDTLLTVNEGGYLGVDWTAFLGATQAIVEGYNYATEAWVEDKGYLTSFTETDPTVPAWAKAASKPSYTLDEVTDGSTRSLANYVLKSGVTVPSTVPVGAWNTESTIGTVDGKNFKIKFPAKPTYAFGDLTTHPTTLSGYGITDAKIANGTITLGSNTITPITSETYSFGSFSYGSGLAEGVKASAPGENLKLNSNGYLTFEFETGWDVGESELSINHKLSSLESGTIGTDAPTSGSSIEVPYITTDSAGHITGGGTHTHTVSGFLTTETDPTVPSWAKAANKPTYTAAEVGALPSNTHIPEDLKMGIVVGKLYRNNVNGTGNISITGNAGYIPTTTVAGTYTVAIYMLSTTQSYTMNVTYGTNTYTLSTTNGVISDVRSLTVAANSNWSASIPGSTPVATGTYLVVTLYKQMTTATTIGVAAVTNNYTDLDNRPSIPTVNNATLTIQKNSTTVASFTANASSGVTANIEVPTKTSDLTNDSLVSSVKINGGSHTPSNGAVDLGFQGYGELIIGTHTEATNLMTGVSKLPTASAMTSGYRFTYWNPYNGTSTAATLTLTFADNSTKTVNLYYKGASRLTSHLGQGSKIDFVYLENANINGTHYTGCWPDSDYNSDTLNARGLSSYYERGKLYSASAPLYRYKICGYRDGKIVPTTITNQTSATQVNKVPTTIAMDVARGLVYYSATTNITAANGTIGAQTLHESYQMTTAMYNFNTSVATYTDVYFQGSYDAETGLFTLDNTQTSGNYRSYYVLATKASGTYTSVFTEGKYYWFVGAAYSTAEYLQLKVENPVYYFNGTQLIPVENLPPNINYDTNLSGSSTNPIENSAVYRQYMTVLDDLSICELLDQENAQSFLKQLPLTFEILTRGNIYFRGYTERTISYRKNEGDWSTITSASDKSSYIEVNKGDVLQFRATNFSSNSSEYSGIFVSDECAFNIYGNIMSLLSPDNFENLTTLSAPNQFNSLFEHSNAKNISKLLLPATVLTESCYYNMFYSSGVTEIPKILPATTLTKKCYFGMFSDCSNLLDGRIELPALTMADSCYFSMFYDCTNLIEAPELPATTLANSCYKSMFRLCTSLQKAPTLIAKTLVPNCYQWMFSNASSLSEITCLAEKISASYCLDDWVRSVAASGTFSKRSIMTYPSGNSGIPSGWTVVNI